MTQSNERTFRFDALEGAKKGARLSCPCVLDEAGEVILEQKLATTREAVEQDFARGPTISSESPIRGMITSSQERNFRALDNM